MAPEDSAKRSNENIVDLIVFGEMPTLFDSKGQVNATGKDLCDCNRETCPGCFFPCELCKSNKCGHQCRCNRDWKYDLWMTDEPEKK